MATTEIKDLRAYQEKLAAYSTEDLEDIYFHIHILRQPLRYKLLVRELESRRVCPNEPSPPRLRILDLRGWLEARPLFARHPWIKAATLSLLLLVLTAAATFAMLVPIWLFAMPLHFIGLQTAIVYFACAPLPPIIGAAIGGRLGGRGLYGVWVLIGVVAGMALFNATGAPTAIIRSLIESRGGGFSFGGF
jgi:hypothetical protein